MARVHDETGFRGVDAEASARIKRTFDKQRTPSPRQSEIPEANLLNVQRILSGISPSHKYESLVGVARQVTELGYRVNPNYVNMGRDRLYSHLSTKRDEVNDAVRLRTREPPRRDVR